MDLNDENGEVEETSPSLNSTAGLSTDDLSAPPDLDGGSDGDAGAGGTNPAPADPNAAAAVRTQTQAPTIRDAARTLGYDLSQYDDDAAAFAHLVQSAQAARQRNYYAELGQQIAPHYQGVSEYLRQQQAQAQPQRQQRDPWAAPEFDERWLNLVEKDPNTGQYVAKPGVNPAFADKVQAYADHLDTWTGQLARDPERALSGLIQKVARDLVQSEFSTVSARQEAQGIIQANETWLYQTDENGRRVVGYDGKFVPTPMGARYYTHLQTLKAAGVNDARTLDALAKQMLQSDIYAGQAQQATPAARPQSAAATARHNVNPGQALVDATRRTSVPAATERRTEGLSLKEMLRQGMAEGGVTDADFAQMYE